MSTRQPPVWQILVINGPNLNLLGTRETSVYGAVTLADIELSCQQQAQQLGLEVAFFQSNHEGALVDRIQQVQQQSVDLIVINPAAYTHTSVALRDALLAVARPVIEVHLSNVYRREPFRHHSFIRDIAVGQITGFGPDVYRLALHAAVHYLQNSLN
ncbi:MAG: type II 3-dehydroquinate dehydratase [Magnetococcales bacterium]|nr:type II 3-dehydroquinate dehydratase [Magnetococcales bacterium]